FSGPWRARSSKTPRPPPRRSLPEGAHQGPLLRPAEPLQNRLPPQRRALVPGRLAVDESHRAATPGVGGPLARGMGGQATRDVVGDAGVEAAVAAAHHVDAP